MEGIINSSSSLDYTSKLSSAQAMENGITLPSASGFESKWNGVTEADESEEFE